MGWGSMKRNQWWRHNHVALWSMEQPEVNFPHLLRTVESTSRWQLEFPRGEVLREVRELKFYQCCKFVYLVYIKCSSTCTVKPAEDLIVCFAYLWRNTENWFWFARNAVAFYFCGVQSRQSKSICHRLHKLQNMWNTESMQDFKMRNVEDIKN